MKTAPHQDERPLAVYLFFGLSLFLLPLVFSSQLLDPVRGPRLLILGSVLFGTSVWAILEKRNVVLTKSILQQNSGLGWLVLSFILVSIISSLLAEEKTLALEEGIRRVGIIAWGWIAWILFVWYPIAKKIALFSLLFFGIVEFILATIHAYHLMGLNLPGGSSVPYGTLTNTNLLASAAWCVLITSFAAYGWFDKKNKILAGSGIVTSLFLIVSANSRAVMLAVVFGLFLLSIYVVSQWFQKKSKAIFLISIFAISLVLGGWFWFQTSWKGNSIHSEIVKHGGLGLRMNPNSQEVRLIIWQSSLEMFFENPLLGIGTGNWPLKAQEKGLVSNELNGDYGTKFFGDPHNDYLLVLAENGLLGFLVFIGIWIWALFKAGKLFWQAKAERDKWLYGSLLIGIAGSMIINFFSIDLGRIFQPLVWACWIAVLAAKMAQKTDEEEPSLRKIKENRNGNRKFSRPLIFFLLTGISGFLIIVLGGISIKRDGLVKEIRDLKASGKWEKMAQKCTQVSLGFPKYDPTSLTPLSWYAGYAFSQLGKPLEAEKSLSLAFQQNPWHPQVANSYAGSLYLSQKYPEAIEAYSRLLGRYPDFSEARLNLAIAYFQTGAKLECRSMLQLLAPDFKPDIQAELNRAIQ